MNTTLLTIVAVIVFVLLGWLGISLIVKSNEIYTESVHQSNQLIEKALDSAFKKNTDIILPSYGTIKDGYAQVTSIFLLAFGIILFVVLLPRLQNISIGPGGVNVTLKDIQRSVETLMQQANLQQAESAGAGGKPVTEEKNRSFTDTVNDDPQKNRWGGKSEDHFRKLSASVKDSPWRGLYEVIITVESTSAKFPLAGVVKFHLHDTFNNPNPVIAAGDNKAVLVLSKVYGAFTVGAEADDGLTKLELDLAALQNAPAGFKDN